VGHPAHSRTATRGQPERAGDNRRAVAVVDAAEQIATLILAPAAGRSALVVLGLSCTADTTPGSAIFEDGEGFGGAGHGGG
jgi:hypothetical protein